MQLNLTSSGYQKAHNENIKRFLLKYVVEKEEIQNSYIL